MTATSPSSAPAVVGRRPSAPLRVAHKATRGLVALATMLLSVAVGELVLAAAPASATVADQTETAVAAINPETEPSVEVDRLLPPQVTSGFRPDL